MKSHSILLSILALGDTSMLTLAQENRAPDGPPDGGPGRRPMSPVIAALDANKDGEIDATEMANVAAALKTLDKNGDGKLSGDEIRPPRGDRGPGGPGRADRPDRGDGNRAAGVGAELKPAEVK